MEQPKQFDLFNTTNSQEQVPRGRSEYTLYLDGTQPSEMSELQRSDLKAYIENSGLDESEKDKIMGELLQANREADAADNAAMYK